MADLEEKRIVDLSHVIEHGMTTYKGLPGPHICDFWTREQSAANYDDGSTFQIGRIDMVANTGTYVDVPSHRFADGEDLSEVGIDSHNIDDTRVRTRPVHTALLGAGIVICEHMTNLGALPDSGFRFTAAPPKVKGMGTFPVRAYALIEA